MLIATFKNGKTLFNSSFVRFLKQMEDLVLPRPDYILERIHIPKGHDYDRPIICSKNLERGGLLWRLLF